MPHSLREILERAVEFADRAERYEPSPDDETTTPEMLLRRAAWKRTQAEADLADAVVQARQAEVSWSTIGDALGTSPQSAQRRYAVVVRNRVVRSNVQAAKRIAHKVKTVSKKTAPKRSGSKRTTT